MKASEARKLTHDHSKRMQNIYKDIEESAKKGNSQVFFHTGVVTKCELDVLIANGYVAVYETSEVDGGQFILVKW